MTAASSRTIMQSATVWRRRVPSRARPALLGVVGARSISSARWVWARAAMAGCPASHAMAAPSLYRRATSCQDNWSCPARHARSIPLARSSPASCEAKVAALGQHTAEQPGL